MAADGSHAAPTGGSLHQEQFHEGLARVMHKLAGECALTRLRIANMCGGPLAAKARVDTQLFRPFQSSAVLLEAEGAAAIASDPVSLDEVMTVARRCSWAGSATSMWEGDPAVAACTPAATAWPSAFPRDFLQAREGHNDRLADALAPIVAAHTADAAALSSAHSFHMIFPLPSFINHASVTNVAAVLIGSTMFVRAARDLSAGEELFVNYFDVAVPLAHRREAELALGFEGRSRRRTLEDAPEVAAMHDAMHAGYQRLSRSCLDPETELDDDKRLQEMHAGYEAQLAATLEHEELMARMELQAHERSWLRASVINTYLFLLTFVQHMELKEAESLQMALTVEGALRETMPGSVLHVASAVKLLDIARSCAEEGMEHAAAARLCRLAVTARYGDVDSMFEAIVNSYLDSDVAQW